MDLSPEDKQRILEEEEKRLAEESYRAQVRQQLLRHDATTDTKPERDSRRRMLILITSGMVVALAVTVLFVRTQTRTPTHATVSSAPVSSQAQKSEPITPPVEASKKVPVQKSSPRSIESLLPVGARIIETNSLPGLLKQRALVLWMIRPTRRAQGEEYCGTSVYGDATWAGPTRVSLVDSAIPKLINTVKIVQPNQAGDSFSLPSFVKGSLYHVPHPNAEQKGVPEILHLQDLTGEGRLAQFALFDYMACGILNTSLFGYDAGSDRVLQYPVEIAANEGDKRNELWVPQVFARKPDGPGYWNFTWSPGHGSDASFHDEVTFDTSRQLFILKAALQNSQPQRAPSRTPVSKPLLSGSVAISPQQVRYWQFAVDTSMTNVHVVGNFHASGGSGNDTEAIVADFAQCENWINGHQAQVLYASGKVTNGTFDVPIRQAGSYCVAFSNKMGVLSPKTVFGNIVLRYLQP